MPTPTTTPAPTTAPAPTPAVEAAPAAVPPPSTGPTAAPTPAATYNPAAHLTNKAAASMVDPAIKAALERRAGGRTPAAPVKVEQLPSTPAELAARTAQQEAQAQQPQQRPVTAPPKPKFVPADEREPAPLKQSPSKVAAEAEQAAAATKQASEQQQQPAAKPAAEQPQQQQQPTTPDDKQLSGPAQLRAAYEAVKKERDTILTERDLTRKESQEFRAKLTAYEERIKGLETVEGRAKEMEKQLLSMDERLRVTDYVNHPEFHDKFVKPVADAMQEGVALVKELMLETGERMGNEADFQEVLAQPNITLAKRKAGELFGESMSAEVVAAYRDVRKHQQAHANAIKNAALDSQKWIEQRGQREAADRAAARTAFESAAKDLEARYPQLYRPPEGDDEAAEARRAGEQLASKVIFGDPNMTPEEHRETLAKVYHRAASFPMRELIINRLTQEVESLKTRLANYEASEPNPDPTLNSAGRQPFAGAPHMNSKEELIARAQAYVDRIHRGSR